MAPHDHTLIWRADGADADVTLLAGDGAGPAAVAWHGRHPVDPGAASEADALGRAVRRAVRSSRGADALVPHGRVLFDALLPPVVRAALRSGAGALTIVSDARWPWPLLHDGAGFVGLRWALGELRLGAGRPPTSTPAEGERLLVVADPAADLPAARYEGEVLMRALTGGEVRCDLRLGRLRRQDFLRLFGGYRLVHFAGHVDPADEAPGGLRVADGRVDAPALTRLVGGAMPSLVFANACRSVDADGGVAEALTAAGVRHVVGTTVDLPDLPGADFAARFYRALRDGASVGEALRSTRAASAEAGEAVWAAYRLFGAPGTIYFRPRPAERWAPGVRQAVVLAVRRPATDAAADPDALAARREQWRAEVRDRVAAHGGRLLPGRAAVDRAVFGVPVTYENDAFRATRAAEAIAAEAADAVVVCEAGPVVATGVDVVGAAALDAEAGCWRAAPGVHGLPGMVRRLADAAEWGLPTGDLRPLVTLGRERPTDESPLVGRAAEVAQVDELAAAVLAEGRPAAVTVVGAAGIGKSRLTRALVRRLSDRFTVIHGAGVPYDEGAPFAAAAGLIRGLCGLPDDAAPEVIRARLDALVERLGATDDPLEVLSIDALLGGGGPDLTEQIPALTAMLGLAPDGPAPEPSVLPAALRALIEAAARAAPLAVVVEDVHWLPDVGLAVIEELVRHLDTGRVLVLATGRSTLVERAPHWFETPRHARLELGPLSARESEAVLRHALGEAVDAATLDALSSRAEGNPLFLRELALARRDGEGPPPPTIEAVMQARLDRLPPFDREVLRAAAVLGRTFWQAGVERLLGRQAGVADALRGLERTRFVLGDATSELPSQRQWRFAHTLLHEVVYHGVAGRARAAWHGRAALWLSDEVEAGPDRWARIAVHRAAAGDHARAAEAWLAAADRAQQTSAAAEARRALGEALGQDDAAGGALDDPTRAAAEEALADLDRGAGAFDDAAARLQAAIARSADPARRGERLMALAAVEEARGDLAAAQARVDEGRAALDGVAGDDARVVALGLRRHAAWLIWRRGEVDAAVAAFEALLAEVPADAAELRGMVLIGLGVAAYGRGDHDAAGRAWRQALALFDQRGDLRRVAACHNNLGMLAHRQGDVRGAAGHFEQALRVHARRGDRMALAKAYNNLGAIYGDSGDHARAAKYLREAVRMRARTGHGGLAMTYVNLGGVELAQGHYDAARGHLEQALALCRAGKAPAQALAEAWLTLSELHLKCAAWAEAIDAARSALTGAREQGDRPRVGAALRLLGEALAAAGELDEADARLAEAIEVLEALEQPIELARACAARARHLERVGDPAAAALAQRAEVLFASVRS